MPSCVLTILLCPHPSPEATLALHIIQMLLSDNPTCLVSSSATIIILFLCKLSLLLLSCHTNSWSCWAEDSRETVTILVPNPPSAAETFAFYSHQMLCQSFPHISLHQISNLWQTHREGIVSHRQRAEEHWEIQELEEKSDIQEQTTSNHQVFPLKSP